MCEFRNHNFYKILIYQKKDEKNIFVFRFSTYLNIFHLLKSNQASRQMPCACINDNTKITNNNNN